MLFQHKTSYVPTYYLPNYLPACLPTYPVNCLSKHVLLNVLPTNLPTNLHVHTTLYNHVLYLCTQIYYFVPIYITLSTHMYYISTQSIFASYMHHWTTKTIWNFIYLHSTNLKSLHKWTHPIYILISCFFTIHLNIILPTSLSLLTDHVLTGFPTEISVISRYLMIRPSTSSTIPVQDLINLTSWSSLLTTALQRPTYVTAHARYVFNTFHISDSVSCLTVPIWPKKEKEENCK
jgi:hypothetical protein